MENTIQAIIEEYGPQLWLGFVTLVATGFSMALVRDLVQNLAYYFRARMSDIGHGQRIYYNREIFIVDRISFRHIVAHDDKKRILIPINKYMEGTIEYPNPRHDDFDENRYHERPWDGKTERRKD